MTGIAPVKRVLIVEDDQDVRGALAAFLEGEGHSVVEAAHGAEALTRLHDSEGICLIVLDLCGGAAAGGGGGGGAWAGSGAGRGGAVGAGGAAVAAPLVASGGRPSPRL